MLSLCFPRVFCIFASASSILRFEPEAFAVRLSRVTQLYYKCIICFVMVCSTKRNMNSGSIKLCHIHSVNLRTVYKQAPCNCFLVVRAYK